MNVDQEFLRWEAEISKALDMGPLGAYAQCRLGEVHIKRYWLGKGARGVGSGNVAIDLPWQGMGLGGRLLAVMEREARERQWQGVVLYTVHNPILRGMLERRGFVEGIEGHFELLF